jgi:hypothetical protein
MLVLPTVKNYKVQVLDNLQWHNARTKFNQNPSSGFQVESIRQTDRHYSPFLRFFAQLMHRTHNNQQSITPDMIKHESAIV